MRVFKLHRRLRLSRPVGVDWFRQLSHEKIAGLKVGEFVWFVVDNRIQCAEIMRESALAHLVSKPEVRGSQVFYDYQDSDKYHSSRPAFIQTGEETGLYRIIDMEEAEAYYRSGAEEHVPVHLKLVANGGGGSG